MEHYQPRPFGLYYPSRSPQVRELCSQYKFNMDYQRTLGDMACFLTVFPKGEAEEKPRFSYVHTEFVMKLIRRAYPSERNKMPVPAIHQRQIHDPVGIDIMTQDISTFYNRQSNLSPHYDAYLHTSAWYIPGGEPVMQQLHIRLGEISERAAFYFSRAVVFDVRS